MSELKKTLKDIDTKARAAKISWLTYTLLYIAAGYMLFVGGWLMGIGMAAVNIVLYLLLGKRMIRSHQDAVNEANIRYGLCTHAKKTEYTGDQGLSAQELEDMHILPIHASDSKLLAKQGFTCRRNGLTVRGHEITFHFPDPAAGRNRYSFLSGSLFSAWRTDGETHSYGNVLLLNNELLSAEVLERFTGECHFIRIPDKTNVSGYSLWTEADCSVPEKTAEELAALYANMPSVSAVRISGQCVSVFLNGRFYTKQVKPGFIPTEKQLKTNPLAERDRIRRFFMDIYEASHEKGEEKNESCITDNGH